MVTKKVGFLPFKIFNNGSESLSKLTCFDYICQVSRLLYHINNKLEAKYYKMATDCFTEPENEPNELQFSAMEYTQLSIFEICTSGKILIYKFASVKIQCLVLLMSLR